MQQNTETRRNPNDLDQKINQVTQHSVIEFFDVEWQTTLMNQNDEDCPKINGISSIQIVHQKSKWNPNALDQKIKQVTQHSIENFDGEWRTAFIDQNLKECPYITFRISSSFGPHFGVMVGIGSIQTRGERGFTFMDRSAPGHGFYMLYSTNNNKFLIHNTDEEQNYNEGGFLFSPPQILDLIWTPEELLIHSHHKTHKFQFDMQDFDASQMYFCACVPYGKVEII